MLLTDGCYIAFQMAEVVIAKNLFANILRRSPNLEFGRNAFEPNSRKRCILITINSTIFVTLWNVMDRRGFNGKGGGGRERQNGQVEPI